MVSTADLVSRYSSEAPQIRAFDVRRDLRPVADLVEKCFADTLDPDGRRYLQQMRSAANSPSFLRWASATAEWASVPLTGYVWEEDGRIVGNISLIPYIVHRRRRFLIANVAVDPDFRRRGIARHLTLRAIEHTRQRGVMSVWLHVRDQNLPARALYDSLGFVEQARRTTWYSRADTAPDRFQDGVVVLSRRPQHWPLQSAWLNELYPPELSWHLPIERRALAPGPSGWLYRLVRGAPVWQRSAVLGGQLLGVLAWQPSASYADHLWLAAAPQSEELAAYHLLLHARRYLRSSRPLSLDYPADRATAAIRAAGFFPHQTLIWMKRAIPEAAAGRSLAA